MTEATGRSLSCTSCERNKLIIVLTMFILTGAELVGGREGEEMEMKGRNKISTVHWFLIEENKKRSDLCSVISQ